MGNAKGKPGTRGDPVPPPPVPPPRDGGADAPAPSEEKTPAGPPTTKAPGGGGGGGEVIPAKGELLTRRRSEVKIAKLTDFELVTTVGRGSFGKVVQVRHKDSGAIFAMKILKKEMVIKRKQVEHTISERKILENIDHPFIVSLRYAFQSEHKLYMVFDFFNGGELYHYLSEGGRFKEDRARFYAAEITSGLNYLHKRKIVYRDLKPENLILDSKGHIRITDFGLSKDNVEGESIVSICGTPEYLAPEILRKRKYGHGVDWWSLGTLIYEMISGLPPFYHKNRQTMYQNILRAELRPSKHMSPEAFDLCSKMLIRDPTKRLGYNGAEEIMAHPFFKGIDWAKLDKMEITPPWTPKVASATDTSNISSDFTSESPAVTPSPVVSVLKDATGGKTPPAFSGFTFTHESVLDGETYRVSFSEDEFDVDFPSGGSDVTSPGLTTP